MARILGVTVEDILMPNKTPRKTGPAGRLQRIFEEAAQLPRSQQDKVIDVLAALIAGMRTNGR